MALDTHHLGLTSVFHHISETGAMRAYLATRQVQPSALRSDAVQFAVILPSHLGQAVLSASFVNQLAGS
jgi:hypothetical protein